MNLPFEHLDEKSREIMVKTIRRRIFDHIGEIVAESPPPGEIVLIS